MDSYSANQAIQATSLNQATKEAPGIINRLTHQRRLLGELHQTILQLRARLEPILESGDPETPVDAPKRPDSPESRRVIDQIEEISRSINILTAEVTGIIHRIQL